WLDARPRRRIHGPGAIFSTLAMVPSHCGASPPRGRQGTDTTRTVYAASFHLGPLRLAAHLAPDLDVELLPVRLGLALLGEEHLRRELARRGRAVDRRVQGHGQLGLRRDAVDRQRQLGGDLDLAPLLLALLVALDELALP